MWQDMVGGSFVSCGTVAMDSIIAMGDSCTGSIVMVFSDATGGFEGGSRFTLGGSLTAPSGSISTAGNITTADTIITNGSSTIIVMCTTGSITGGSGGSTLRRGPQSPGVTHTSTEASQQMAIRTRGLRGVPHHDDLNTTCLLQFNSPCY